MSKKYYSVEDVQQAGCTLEPMQCIYCTSEEVIYNQYVEDACCERCGNWQDPEADEVEFNINYKALDKEFLKLPYGDIPVKSLSKKAQYYINLLVDIAYKEIKEKNNLIHGQAVTGCHPLIGLWNYTKTHGIRSHINKFTVWDATIKSHPVNLEDYINKR